MSVNRASFPLFCSASALGRIFLLFLAVLVLGSCTTLDKIDPLAGKPLPSIEEKIQDGMPDIRPDRLANQRTIDRTTPISGKIPASEGGYLSDTTFRADLTRRNESFASRRNIPKEKLRQFDVEFDDTSLRTVVEFVFSQYIEASYVIDSNFNDREVNWVASGKYTQQEILGLFENFLSLQGVNVVKNKSGYYISTNPVPASVADQGMDLIGQTTQMWQLQYISLPEVLPIIRQFVQTQNRVNVIPSLNVLSVSSSRTEIDQIDKFITRVDIAHLQNKSILIYAPRYISVEALTAQLQNLPVKMGFRTTDRNPSVEAEAISGTNRVVIVTGTTDLKEVVKEFIAEIDQPGDSISQIFYYPLRNQDATEVSETLKTLLPGLSAESASQDIKVVVHASTNSILVQARPEQYYEIRQLINRLDFNVPSVMIDATIVEVQLEDSLAYGVQWFLNQNGDNTYNFNLSNATNIATAAVDIDIASLPEGSAAALDLIAAETDLTVLSRPRLLVRNQATATIKSTDKIRVVKSELVGGVELDGTDIPQREFEEEEFGITLVVTPNIADDGTITMVVEIEDSRRGANDTSTGESQPTFNTRQITTELVVKDTQTVMIGGLIKSEDRRDRTKVPVLGDIPILGHAFSNRTDSADRTELIVFITPYIVLDQTSARVISEAFAGIELPAFRYSENEIEKQEYRAKLREARHNRRHPEANTWRENKNYDPGYGTKARPRIISSPKDVVLPERGSQKTAPKVYEEPTTSDGLRLPERGFDRKPKSTHYQSSQSGPTVQEPLALH